MSEIAYTNNGEYFFTYQKRTKFVSSYPSTPSPDNPAPSSSRLISNKNLSIGFSSKGLSPATKRKISFRIRVLSHSAQRKKVKDFRGDYIFHVCSFYTLTLPSTQVHTDQVITKKVLGHFLDLCRKNNFLHNYVWRAEKQKNGNIHYHIVTDSYVPKGLLYRYWLMSCERLGYVSAYHDKFANMSFQEYNRTQNNGSTPLTTMQGRYWKGNRNGWRKPPCFDVINCDSFSGVSKYISKYISKDDASDYRRVTGRCWGCSQSINDGARFFKEDKDFNEFGYRISMSVLRRPVVVAEFFTMVRSKISSFFVWFPKETADFLARLRALVPPCQYYCRGLAPLFPLQ